MGPDRPSGIVEDTDSGLVVRVGDSVDAATWDDVRAVMRPLRGQMLEPGRAIEVARDRAGQLRDVLARYPATRVAWSWPAAPDPAGGVDIAGSPDLGVVVDTGVEEQSRWPVDVDLAGAGFTRDLRPFQVHSVARLLTMGNGADFSVPGSGKTTVAYAVFAALRQLGVADVMLVLAPPSAFEAWEAEAVDCFAAGHRPRLGVRPRFAKRDVDVLILNYERLELRRTFAEVDAWAGNRRVLFVIDEAHRVKAGAAGVRGRGARTLAERSHRRLVLTGTPMPNGPDDLAAVLDLAWPEEGSRLASGDLAGRRERAFVRVTKADLELPALTTRVEVIPLDASHRRLYDALAGRIGESIVEGVADAAEIGRAVMRLIAAASNPAAVLDRDGPFGLPAAGSDADLRTLLADPTAHVRPAKVIRVAQLVSANAARGRKTLIWSNFLGNVAALTEALASYSPAVVTGATPVADDAAPTDRHRELRRFRTDPSCKVLIATPHTLGEGVSLHRACFDQIHLDRGFAAGTFLQSLDRTHRLGMDPASAPTCTILLAADTIDLVVHDVMSRKIGAMASALDDEALRPVADPQLTEPVTLDDLLLGDADPPGLLALLRAVIR